MSKEQNLQRSALPPHSDKISHPVEPRWHTVWEKQHTANHQTTTTTLHTTTSADDADWCWLNSSVLVWGNTVPQIRIIYKETHSSLRWILHNSMSHGVTQHFLLIISCNGWKWLRWVMLLQKHPLCQMHLCNEGVWTVWILTFWFSWPLHYHDGRSRKICTTEPPHVYKHLG